MSDDLYLAACRKLSTLTTKVIKLESELALCYTGFSVTDLHGHKLNARSVADAICDGGVHSSAVFALTETGELLVVDRESGQAFAAPDYYNITSMEVLK